MNHRLLKLIGVTLLFAGLITSSYAEGVKDGKKNTLGKTAGNPSRTLFNINNISTWFSSDGQSDLNPQGNSGFVFPKGSGKAAVFQSGFVWGGKVDGNIRVGGVTYQSGLKSGRIISQGVAQDPEDADARIYRVRPDWRTGSMNAEMRDGEGTEADIRAQYEKDWNEWPAQFGAPYKDVDGNGSYDPNIDIPGVPVASQTIWYVANDLDATTCSSLYGSNPIGIELQTTIWGYSSAGALGNMLFRKYKIINKSGKDITDMYVSNWSDIDDGDATDDYAACDTTLSLAYCYNASVPDGVYGANPPAVGFDFFQGPVVPGAPNDSAIFNGKRLHGKKNLPMTAFYYFINSNAIMADPTLGTNYQAGTLRFWNLFQGKISTTGQYFPIPASLGGGVTKFPLSGDPVKGTGYLDGILFPKDDRRIGSASGPFVMAAQDTQEIVVAEIAAGGPGSGLNNIKAVELLKNYDNIAQNAYDEFFVLPSAPEPPKVDVAELDRQVILSWGSDLENVKKTENHNAQGFTFQGYNVYQLPSSSATLKEAYRIATFDKIDEIKYILGDVVDPSTGVTLKAVQQFGSDNGIQRSIKLEKDYFTNMPLVNGKKYYYAVTAYAYTPDPLAVPNNLENPLNILTLVPHSNNPGVEMYTNNGAYSNVTHDQGMADAQINVKVIDPTKVKGGKYTINWSTIPDKLSFSGTDENGNVTLSGKFLINVDGSKLEYKVNVDNLDSLSSPITKLFIADGGVAKDLNFIVVNDTVSGIKSASASGVWTSTDAKQPLTSQLIQDMRAGTVSVIAATSANANGEVEALVGIDTYPWLVKHNGENVVTYLQSYESGADTLSGPMLDGMKIQIGNAIFNAPITYEAKGMIKKVDPNTDRVRIWGDAYSIFGYASGLASEFYGGGENTTKVDLIQDLEFRFTGVSAVPGVSDTTVTSGGSIATMYSRKNTKPVRVRIPFEVWEVERNRQINIAIVDRNIDGKSSWGDTGIPKFFRTPGREYMVIIATPYNSDTSAATAASLPRNSKNSTWFLIFDSGESQYVSHWDTGDIYKVKYSNNIVPENDSYSFTAPNPVTYADDKAKVDVEKINV
ncbi:MAG: hypothetical protein ACM3MI_14795, partial [Clostridiales bacterium]